MSKPSFIRRFFSAIWNGITRIRLALSNIFFLLMLAIIYFVYIGGTPEPLPERAALLLGPAGSIVDQKSFVEPLAALFGKAAPEDREVLLRDVIEAIETAKDDPNINSMVMELDHLASVGISKTQEIVRAVEAFKASGKPVVAVGDYYGQSQYLLASHADTIIVHPFGGVALEGFSSYHNYFREALEKLSINMHVFKAGDHKSIAEPFLRDDMSPEQKEISSRWLEGIWAQYTEMVEGQRDLAPGSINSYINNYAENLKAHGGDTANAALQAGLVDRLMGRNDANEYLMELVGASNEDGLYEAVGFEHYLSRKRPLISALGDGNRVAVITAQGNMLNGDQPPGSIGGDSLARLIHATAEEDGVAAIVLRINSGGGSVFASEIIRQEILRTKNKGLPVVVSMGSVAASGGYYIAAQVDQIWATPATITGSIGVIAAFPTLERLYDRFGVHTDGVGTTELAGSLRLDRPLNPQVSSSITSSVENTYRGFVSLVAKGRGMTPEAVDLVAQGRVWSAPDAMERGLVDKLGHLEDAIKAAAELAKLDDYTVDYVGLPMSPRDMLLQHLADRAGSLRLWTGSSTAGALSRFVQPLVEAAEEIGLLNDPANLYMRCLACRAVN
ncbi:MAG: signal peptide peptidase SppA [Proteobacteria bacterium]|nr:signal peptide peptidase SppA [Pseudomonadota bacterium]